VTPLRVGLLGGGWIARVHVPAIAAAGADLVAVCDIDAARAASAAAGCGAAVHTDWEQMLAAERLDALWICTPPLRHRAPAEAALRAGLHVYLEKPIARTVEDGEAIVRAAAASDAVCAVGYQWHASELVSRARELLAGGPPALLVGRNFGPVAGRPWFMDPGQGGGQILERGSHHVDLQRSLAGEVEAVRVSAAGPALSGAPGSQIDDALVMELRFAAGTVGSVHIAWTRDGQPGIYATDVLADNVTLALELGSAPRLTGMAGGHRVEEEGDDPMDRSIRRFLAAVASGDREAVACTPQDALRTLRVAAACERALAQGGEVAV
jgi:myo-inositol 2-dehydrogenase / D-chiro-inositol 1-dehydrogenase